MTIITKPQGSGGGGGGGGQLSDYVISDDYGTSWNGVSKAASAGKTYNKLESLSNDVSNKATAFADDTGAEPTGNPGDIFVDVLTDDVEINTVDGWKKIAKSEDIGNGTVTINQGGVEKGTFTMNQSGNTTINLSAGAGGANWGDIGGTLSNQTDLNTALESKANTSDLSTVATSGKYEDLTGKPHFILVEDTDYTVAYSATKGVAPRSTSYGTTDVTITNTKITAIDGALYQFLINTKPGTTTYRNIRVRFGETGEWYGLGNNSSVSAQYTYFTKAYPGEFIFKPSVGSACTTKFFAASFVNTTYSPMSAAEATTGTATSGRLMTAKVLNDKITERLGSYYTSTEIDSLISGFGGFQVVGELPTEDIKTNIIYLKGPIGTGADKYEEWIYSNSQWTKIGDTSVDLSPYEKTADVNTKLAAKQDTISDLDTIRSGAGLGATASQPGHSHVVTDITNISSYHDSTKQDTISDLDTIRGNSEGAIQNPEGGTAGQVLTKTESGYAWQDASGGISSTTVSNIWTGTETEYNAITTKSASTLYFVKE